VHDLTFMRYPEHAPPGLVSYLNEAVPRSVRRARLILADSESTRRDLIEMLQTPPDKVRVVYAGVGSEFRPVTDVVALAAVKTRYQLAQPFILTVGTLQPRKNHLRLVQAFSRVAAAHRDVRLVIAGGKGWSYDETAAEIARLNLGDRVIFPGFVSEEDLAAVYSLARALAFPSLYEGFGLPVLEAMACGTPVVCANASSLPEVAGDAAVLVDPLDVDGLAEALERVLDDDVLRQELIRRGHERAARFTWAAAANALLAAYCEAVRLPC
jgi:glycosyltransferase involved in cell wall biosynthesis